MIVLGVAVAVVVYAYGWEATNIGLETTTDPVRQAAVTRALRELLSPNIFSQDRETEAAVAYLHIGDCEDVGEVEQPPRTEGAPYIEFSPACADAEQIITVSGYNFHADAVAQIRLVRDTGQRQPFNLPTQNWRATKRPATYSMSPATAHS
ncbi:MAG: hypothetical protein M5R40_00870 [Anaerolineae bacterium]|nr:hypothetical protein [Anaerolineae bacterium]